MYVIFLHAWVWNKEPYKAWIELHKKLPSAELCCLWWHGRSIPEVCFTLRNTEGIIMCFCTWAGRWKARGFGKLKFVHVAMLRGSVKPNFGVFLSSVTELAQPTVFLAVLGLLVRYLRTSRISASSLLASSLLSEIVLWKFMPLAISQSLGRNGAWFSLPMSRESAQSLS